MIALRSICGNIIAICSTSAGFAIRGFPRGAVVEDFVKKKYRIVKAVKAARRRREGMERVCCWSDMIGKLEGGAKMVDWEW
jgi:hypothetical protein